jgi:hypothetical protein
MPVHFLLVFLIVSFLEDTLLLNQCGQQQRDNYRTFTTMNFLDKSTKALSVSQGECECFSQQAPKQRKMKIID